MSSRFRPSRLATKPGDERHGTGVAQRILERELAPVGAAFAPASAPELVDALVGMIEIITGPGRDVTTARLILFMEASHDAALRAELSRGRGDRRRLGRAHPAPHRAARRQRPAPGARAPGDSSARLIGARGVPAGVSSRLDGATRLRERQEPASRRPGR
jgi:hypothetical protein